MVLLWISVALPLPTEAVEVASQMVVERAGEEDRALEMIWHSLVANRVGRQAAAQSLKTLDAYIGAQIAQGKKVTLFPPAIGAVARVAAQSDWTAAEIGSLLVYVQKKIDAGERASFVMERVTAAIRAKEPPSTVLAALAETPKPPVDRQASARP